MKLRKTLILFSLLVTLSSSTTSILASEIKTNNDVIVVDDKKVNLRQKAIKKANSNTIDEANIETTNVDYDLRYLFGGEKNYLTYNIWNLKPTEINSKDTSFKFICAKPVGTNLYLYVYHNDSKNGEIVSATFNISKSKVQNQETGKFEESFSRYNARFINSYGYKERFMKFAIDNIISTTEDVRCYIDECYITYQDKSTTKNYYSSIYDVNDEFAFNVGNNTDFMYQYFKDDYVNITDGEVSLLLTNIDEGIYLSDFVKDFSMAEDFYYFFSTDKKMDELIEIQYDYLLLSYTHYNANAGRYYSSSNALAIENYSGLYEDANAIDYSIESKVNNKITKGTTSTEYTRPYFLWWNKDYTYQLENIQNCLDTSNLNTDENKGFKEFIEEVQNNRVANNKSKYQWAFRVDSLIRELEVVKFHYKNPVDFIAPMAETESYCHEVLQSTIVWLKFRTGNQEFEFNVLDIPKDTTSIYIQNVPYETLSDIIVNKILSGWNWFKDAFNNIKNNLIPLLISLVVIIAVVACWPIITSFTKLVSSSINMATDKKVKKKNKNKKE